ncbi:MAG: penicillin-binding protein 1C, partial [Myxococcales bacterium]|nr:penicillin-binding protein 1C [Polyangiaceae bacterium]MDW8249525.1 penicillin-binding protein 1C [Myxococcales bacterium]
MSRRRRLLLLGAVILLGPWVGLVLLAAFTPLPPQLREDMLLGSTRILDRDGRLLRHARAGDGTWMQRASLEELGPQVPAALLAAEDRRFFWHPGIDPLAILRALGQFLAHRRILSGGSTLTQQLARTLVPRPRTLTGKVREMALALRMEASLSKRQILEAYLSQVSFGPAIRGVEAASRAFFDKPARELSLAEAALIAGMPQSPTFHDPRRNPERARRRRDWILTRMAALGLASQEEVERALHEPLTLTHWSPEPLAPHLVQSLLEGPWSPGPAAEVTTTLDRGLQRIAEEATRRTVKRLEAQQVTAAALVVLENATGEILAYVGSPSIHDLRRLGANDGVLARRQPGSALKPFIYELALERLGWNAATLLPDVEISFPGATGVFQPQNYDGRLRGPVRLREALANSLNLPAVWTASQLGPEQVLERLLTLGFRSLDRPPEHYGVAIALGDGEVTLLELAQAYATLARGGLWLPARAIRSFRTWDGELHVPARPEPVRKMDGRQAATLVDILSDPRARSGSFGRDTPLDFPFPVAAKTGTSKGFRDNVTAGFTREVTVAVWVGNFDGRPMQSVSGITGAAPLFHEVMMAAMVGRIPGPLPSTNFTTRTICALSGALIGPDCPHGFEERFLPEQAPEDTCTMHRTLPVDTRTGLIAG